ncbi:MAG: YgeY family selenium metabolism-linked hydrolase [Synergistaceae bacterium]|jgi:putative selenium metabolism hydrolase|nr:YgeY family selenium metabolism-linked hydrolase [Synergistaceae bacterium]
MNRGRSTDRYENDLVAFAQVLVRAQSVSGHEGDVARLTEAKMRELGYDEVFIDRIGNVVGRIGNGEKTILFDSHMDTVEVVDAEAWKFPPFGGDIVEGRLYGRGSVDMKSALAASLYAPILAREAGCIAGRTVYVTATVCEEFCDGENLKVLFGERGLRPDWVVICEPSDNVVTLGHKGKAQALVTTHGISAHGSAPEKGLNAVYEMAEIIQRVERLNARLTASGTPHGTIVLSDISSVSASLNAVPSECSIYLDRRLVPGETEEDVRGEMNDLIAGKKAAWQLGTLKRTTWTGAELTYEPLHAAWKIDENHELARACRAAFTEVFGAPPNRYDFWDFSTNAVTPVSMGIPVIGFGPGEYKLAHMRDESCEVEKIKSACRFYASLIGKIGASKLLNGDRMPERQNCFRNMAIHNMKILNL